MSSRMSRPSAVGRTEWTPGGRAEASTGDGHGRAPPPGGVGARSCITSRASLAAPAAPSTGGGGRQPTDRHPGVRGEQTTHGKAGSELSQLGFLVLRTPALSRTLGSRLERWAAVTGQLPPTSVPDFPRPLPAETLHTPCHFSRRPAAASHGAPFTWAGESEAMNETPRTPFG